MIKQTELLKKINKLNLAEEQNPKVQAEIKKLITEIKINPTFKNIPDKKIYEIIRTIWAGYNPNQIRIPRSTKPPKRIPARPSKVSKLRRVR
jgi:hypothetical protein